jgi:hypothetical protein
MASDVGEYTFDFDIPYSELTELGWAKVRMLNDVKSSKQIKRSDNVVIEPKTGTLMLKPKQLAPFSAAELDYAANYWLEIPEGMNALSFDQVAGERKVMRSKGYSLYELLEDMAVTSLQAAILAEGQTLVPILSTKNDMPANQAISIRTTFFGAHGTISGKDWLAIRFGDFLLSLSMDGTADLYWSTDGSCDEDKWEHRKTFSNIPDVRNKSILPFNIAGVGVAPFTYVRLDIIPMGRGHIWFRLRAPGFTFSDVYTHPEATSDVGLYSITQPGKIVVLVPDTEEKSVDVQICPLGHYESGTFKDVLWNLPYKPSLPVTFDSQWTYTNGNPSVNYSLKNKDGVDWISDGTNQNIQVYFV